MKGREWGGEGRGGGSVSPQCTCASLLHWCVLCVRHWGADDVSDSRPEARSAQPGGEGTAEKLTIRTHVSASG